MQLLPVNVPAEIRRSVNQDGADILVARGPLIIMAHGLMALDPADRGEYRIWTEEGDLTVSEAEAAIRDWSRRN